MSSLLKMLVLFHHDDKASDLQTRMTDFLKLIEQSIPEIWDPDQQTSSTTPVRYHQFCCLTIILYKIQYIIDLMSLTTFKIMGISLVNKTKYQMRVS